VKYKFISGLLSEHFGIKVSSDGVVLSAETFLRALPNFEM